MAFNLKNLTKNNLIQAQYLLAVYSLLCFGLGHANTTISAYGFPIAKLQIGMHIIQAEIAATQAARMQGLMHRQQLEGNQGMVFLFDTPNTQCMWMRNTYVPLSVAFINAAGKVTNIKDMEPQSETNHCSSKPAKYALEMPKGWFLKHDVKAGDAVKGLDLVK